MTDSPRPSHISPEQGEVSDECQCPKCGRLHRSLRAGIPPSSISGDLYVPGMWRCAKCAFVLTQSTLHADDGSITARDKPGEKCPNCDVPLWRLTWREHASELAERLEFELHSRRSPPDSREREEAIEECAKVCDELIDQALARQGQRGFKDGYDAAWIDALNHAAGLIRLRALSSPRGKEEG